MYSFPIRFEGVEATLQIVHFRTQFALKAFLRWLRQREDETRLIEAPTSIAKLFDCPPAEATNGRGADD